MGKIGKAKRKGPIGFRTQQIFKHEHMKQIQKQKAQTRKYNRP
jgi:hypothetical protein